MVAVGGYLVRCWLMNRCRCFKRSEDLHLGKTSATFTVPVQSELGEKSNEFHPIPLKYDPTYIEEIIVQSKQNIILAGSKVLYPQSDKPVQIQAREDFIWRRGMNTTPPIPMYIGGSVFAQNLEIDPAEVTFTIQTVAPYKETSSIFVIAAIVIWIGLAWMLQLSSAPRLAAISMSAAKNELSQPLPWILLLIGSIFLVSFVHLPYHTEGEDIKILKECGLTLILVVCLFQGVWSASSSVSDEIEGRTALTLMSKPVHRRSFIIGKMLGNFLDPALLSGRLRIRVFAVGFLQTDRRRQRDATRRASLASLSSRNDAELTGFGHGVIAGDDFIHPLGGLSYASSTTC